MFKNYNRDFNAFRGRLKSSSALAYETRDENPSVSEVKEAVDNVQQLFAEFKSSNDKRLEQIEKRGASDPLTKEEVDKIHAELKQAKDTRDALDELTKRVGRLNLRQETRNDASAVQLQHRDAFISMIRNPDDADAKAALQKAEKAARDERIEIARKEGIKDLERRAATIGTGSAGGYAVPDVLDSMIMRELTEISPLRNLVEVINVGNTSFTRLVDIGGASYGWVGEGDARTETDTPALAEVNPTFGMIYAYPKASEESLNDIFYDVENWLISSAVEGFSAGEENAIVSGNGTKKPTGFLNGTPVVTADGARAFGVLQYVKTGAAAAFAADDPTDVFLSAIYTLKKEYRANARFMMNKASAGTVMKFKDGDGNYFWQPSSVLGQPDRLMGYPVSESEEMPDIAANAFPVAFGDFKQGYLLCDLVGVRITRDDVTTPGYEKFYIRRRMGGKVTKSEAIKLIKCEA